MLGGVAGGDVCGRGSGGGYPRLNLKAHGLGLMHRTASTMMTHTDLLQHRDDFGVVFFFGIIESCLVILPPRGECMWNEIVIDKNSACLIITITPRFCPPSG